MAPGSTDYIPEPRSNELSISHEHSRQMSSISLSALPHAEAAWAFF